VAWLNSHNRNLALNQNGSLPARFQKAFANNLESLRRGGGDDDSEALYNDEIETIAKHVIPKNYIPVIALDEADTLEKYVKPYQKQFGFVFNTSTSDSDGSGEDNKPVGHWCSVYINNEDDYPTVEIYDPLCMFRPSHQFLASLKRIVCKMNPECLFKVKYSRIQQQSFKSAICGFFATHFLEQRFHGVPFSTASGFDSYMDTVKIPIDMSEQGEKEMKPIVKRYNSYL